MTCDDEERRLSKIDPWVPLETVIKTIWSLGLDHIPVSVFTQISTEDGRVERHKFNIGTRQLSRIRRPGPHGSHARTRNLCFVARQLRLCDIWWCHMSRVTTLSPVGSTKIADAFLCSQVTNHSSRDKMLVFHQTVLLCSNFVCICRLICWMIQRMLSSCSAWALLLGTSSWQESARMSPDLCLILYSRKVSCRKVSLSRTRCAGRGPGLVPLRFPLVPLNWISDDIRKNHLVHWRDIIEFHTGIDGGQLWEWMVLL